MAKTAPSDGDRKDLGGKIPQFDAFAFFAYKELVRNELEWIKVADNEALTLDDIQYSTKNEIHAFQVKWSNLPKPEPFSYVDLKNLLPEIFSGWKALKLKHTGSLKELKVHLLSNRPPSTGDNIKDGKTKLGSNTDFMREVWANIKNGQPVPAKWMNIFNDFKNTLSTTGNEWDEFIESFEINLGHTPEEFGTGSTPSIKNRHLIDFSRYIIEQVIDKKKPIHFTAFDIIKHFGWEGMFSTIFNHDLLIDPDRYQPIAETKDALDTIIDQNTGGYVFLLGGPGTGKSTLLTEWSKSRKERIIRYYAFDFTSPSAFTNNAERGETMTFYYDLVSQLKADGIYKEQSLIDRDINFLRKALEAQLLELSDEYRSTGRKTIIVCDGLDHIPRYSGVQKPFLADLLLPEEIPEGVFIVLGSQSFELTALPQEIKEAWKAMDRSVVMARLTKQDVENYIAKIATVSLNSEQKEKLFTLSQGHPLYLSYVVNKINQDGSFLPDSEFLPIDGDINLYYEKFWSELESVPRLKHLLGLCARIKGPIPLSFIAEWNLGDEVELAFKHKAMFLFNNMGNSLSFFHNSFRQFLLTKTATSALNDTFDKSKDVALHEELAGYYQKSGTEPGWNAGYHLYYAGKTEEFLQTANPTSFTEQLLRFRSDQEIDSDIKKGLLVAQEHSDTSITLRYLLSLNEMESRSRHTGVASYIEEFIQLGNIDQAKKLIRNDTQLLVNKSYALDCAQALFDANEKQEAKLVYTLAIPDEVKRNRIVFSHKSHELYRTLEQLEKWIGCAGLFEKAKTIIDQLSNISIKDGDTLDPEELKTITNRLYLSAAESYILQENWTEYDILMEEWTKNPNCHVGYYAAAIIEAAHQSIHTGEVARAEACLTILKAKKTEWAYTDYKKLRIAALFYNAKRDMSEVKDWIQDVPQPELIKKSHNTPDITFQDFTRRILLNTLLTLTGDEPNILEVVKKESPSDDQLHIQFERMLVLIAKLHANGITNTGPQDIWQRVVPIIRFYYAAREKYDTTWYSLDRMKKDYFALLLNAVSRWGEVVFKDFIDNLLKEIKTHKESWKPEIIRDILLKAYDNGYPKEAIVPELEALESEMLHEHDTSGRVDECYLHAKAWVHLEEKNKALSWLSKSLKESFSVGYRKDYQYNRWLEWLVKVNTLEPQKTAERLVPFLGFLPHLKQTVEGSPFYHGARKVLEIGYSVDFSTGVQQFIWQMENGVVAFEDGLSLSLLSLISHANSDAEIINASLIYEKLLLYIAEDDTSNVLKELLKKQFQLLDKSVFENSLRSLINSINTYCLETNRPEAIKTIQGFLDENGIKLDSLPMTVIKSDKVVESQNELIVTPDYKHISESEVLSRVNSFSDFMTLLNSEDKANSFFSWGKVIQKISPTLTLENLKEIVALNPKSRRQSELLSLFSIRAMELGDETLARQLADRSLSQSSSSGWSSFYDGGTRLQAMRAFQKVNETEGRQLALRTLTEDIMQSNDPDSTLASWDEILPLISKDSNPVQIWEEIEGYLKRLFGNADLLPVPEFKPINQKEALVMLLKYLSEMKVKAISTTSKTVLAEMAIKDPDYLSILHNHV
ncbi:MAG: ATP-binding protein [Bacteroidetes bacterium]|nr:ATP-binding protein [Bacteroidota bacterium]